MNKLTNIIALSIENLPVAVAVGLITLLLGLGLVGGQFAPGSPDTPLAAALVLAALLIIIGAVVIAAPLLTLFAMRRAALGQPDGEGGEGVKG